MAQTAPDSAKTPHCFLSAEATKYGKYKSKMDNLLLFMGGGGRNEA